MAFYQNEQVFFNKSAAYIEGLSLATPEFIYFFLKSDYIFHYFEDFLSGTTIRNLSLYTLRNAKFFYYSLKNKRRSLLLLKKRGIKLMPKLLKPNALSNYTKNIAPP